MRDPILAKLPITVPASQRRLKIAYLSGPSDAPAAYRKWSEGSLREYFGTDYMSQFLQVGEELGSEIYVITTLGGKYSLVREGRFIFENRPNPAGLKGVLYHLAFILWYARLIPSLVRFRPDVLFVTANESYWFMLCFLPWLGITILPSFHGTPWPKFGRRKLSSRILWQLNRFMLLKYLKVMVVTSNDITRQINELLGNKIMSRVEIKRHFPTYSPAQFASIPPPDSATRPPFRVFFAGRIEADKGIFDIVEIANQLQSARPGFFHFDICGEGSQLGALRKKVVDLKVQDTVSCHGYTTRTKFTELLAASHAWIVPTRTEYAAGFEMVCAEAILAGRPLVTSAVCPALEDLRDASIEVEPDNIDQYREAIVKLSEDKQLYVRKHLACSALHGPFYDIKDSWGAKMIEALVHIKLVRT